MKPVLTFLGALGFLLAVVFLASPARGKALVRRALGFPRLVPEVEVEGPAAPQGTPAAAPAPKAEPEWRTRARSADAAYAAGEFARAADEWALAARKAPSAEGAALRARADRARVFQVLASDAAGGPLGDSAASEKEYRRRVEALKDPAAGEWLEIAAFAGEKGLRHHLAWLYERAFEKRTDGNASFDKAVAAAYRERKKARGAPPPEVAEAIVREMPAGEAAELAEEDTGGIGGSARRGEAPVAPEDRSERAAEARRLKDLGDAEYRKAVPGTPEVNKHRRAALDAYEKAREIFQELERESGRTIYQRVLHDLNRNIAELHKDLPVGK